MFLSAFQIATNGVCLDEKRFAGLLQPAAIACSLPHSRLLPLALLYPSRAFLETGGLPVADITDLLREFQNAQKSMTQTMGDQQQVLKDFREIIALILERLERSQSKTKEYLSESQQEIANLQDQFSTMQQEISNLLGDLKTSRESLQE